MKIYMPATDFKLPFYQNRYCLVVVILTLGLIPYFSANGILCFSDSTVQVMPLAMETKRMLMSGAPWWSWNTFLGDNFIGGYSYFTYPSPFMWIILLFPMKYIGLGMLFGVYLKALACAFFSYRYFLKMGVDKRLSNMGALLYTFCGFAILTSTYYIFMEPILIFPLVLIATERFVRREKYAAIGVLGVFSLVIMANYYFAPMMAMIAGMYLVARCVDVKRTVWQMACDVARFGVLCIIGYALMSVIVVPTALQLVGAPKADGLRIVGPIWIYLERIRNLFMPPLREGPKPDVLLLSSWDSASVFIIVFGILPAVLYVCRHIRNWLSLLLVLFLIFYVTPLGSVFQMFTDETYVRWLFGPVLLIILATLKYLGENDRIRFVAPYALLCVMAYAVPTLITYIYRNKNGLEYSPYEKFYYISLFILLAVNLGFLFAVRKRNTRRWYAVVLAGITVCATANICIYWVEGHVPGLFSRGEDGVYTLYRDRIPYNESNDMHYRTDYELPETRNLATMKNTPCTKSYHSLQNPAMHDLFWAVDTFPYSHTIFSPTINRASFDALVSVRELITLKGDTVAGLPLAGTDATKSNDVYTWSLLKYYIPMGFAYDRYVVREEVTPDMRIMPHPDIPLLMLGALVVSEADEPELSKYLVRTEKNYSLDLDSVVSERRKVVCDTFSGDTRGFKARITLDEPRVIFFSVFADPGFTATIDGSRTKIYNVNIGMSAIVVPAGEHNIEFSYFTPGLKAGMWISLCALLLALGVFYADYRKTRAAALRK